MASLDPPATVAAAQGRELTVQDRLAEERRLLSDPIGAGLLAALLAAAAGAAALAVVGLVVDARVTAVARQQDLAVLYTLGASRPVLGRALVVEQAVLAGFGVVVGAVIGIAIAATMGTLLILTPAGRTPVPGPEVTLSLAQVVVPVAGLLAVALAAAMLVARGARHRLAAGGLRIGE